MMKTTRREFFCAVFSVHVYTAKQLTRYVQINTEVPTQQSWTKPTIFHTQGLWVMLKWLMSSKIYMKTTTDMHPDNMSSTQCQHVTYWYIQYVAQFRWEKYWWIKWHVQNFTIQETIPYKFCLMKFPWICILPSRSVFHIHLCGIFVPWLTQKALGPS